MRDQHYKNKTIRIADETWERLKNRRRKSGKTWNLFLIALMKKKFLPENPNYHEASPAKIKD
jgi:predicted DNA-binding protein